MPKVMERCSLLASKFSWVNAYGSSKTAFASSNVTPSWFKGFAAALSGSNSIFIGVYSAQLYAQTIKNYK